MCAPPLLIQALEARWGLRVAMGMGQDAVRWEQTEAGNGGNKKGEYFLNCT